MEAAEVFDYRTNPQNLDLQVTFDGTKYYFSQSEWNNLSSSEQSRLANNKSGVVIDYNGVRSFVVKLDMERHGSGYRYERDIYFTWDEAKRWVNNLGSGWRLPNKDEGQAMADQYETVCSAIKAFGGDSDPAWWYWTSNESSASRAWFFCLGGGYVSAYVSESSYFCVRAVRAI